MKGVLIQPYFVVYMHVTIYMHRGADWRSLRMPRPAAAALLAALLVGTPSTASALSAHPSFNAPTPTLMLLLRREAGPERTVAAMQGSPLHAHSSRGAGAAGAPFRKYTYRSAGIGS